MTANTSVPQSPRARPSCGPCCHRGPLTRRPPAGSGGLRQVLGGREQCRTVPSWWQVAACPGGAQRDGRRDCRGRTVTDTEGQKQLLQCGDCSRIYGPEGTELATPLAEDEEGILAPTSTPRGSRWSSQRPTR